MIRRAENGGPLEQTSLELLAQLYSTPEMPLTAGDLPHRPLRAAKNRVPTDLVIGRWRMPAAAVLHDRPEHSFTGRASRQPTTHRCACGPK